MKREERETKWEREGGGRGGEKDGRKDRYGVVTPFLCITIVYTGDDGNSISLETKEESPVSYVYSGPGAY